MKLLDSRIQKRSKSERYWVLLRRKETTSSAAPVPQSEHGFKLIIIKFVNICTYEGARVECRVFVGSFPGVCLGGQRKHRKWAAFLVSASAINDVIRHTSWVQPFEPATPAPKRSKHLNPFCQMASSTANATAPPKSKQVSSLISMQSRPATSTNTKVHKWKTAFCTASAEFWGKQDIWREREREDAVMVCYCGCIEWIPPRSKWNPLTS